MLATKEIVKSAVVDGLSPLWDMVRLRLLWGVGLK